MHLNAAFLARLQTETQQVKVGRAIDLTLFLVDLEAKMSFDKTTNRVQHSEPRTLATHEDVAIVGVTYKAQTPPLQFPIQLVEDDIGQ
jgi:hypothetical protein